MIGKEKEMGKLRKLWRSPRRMVLTLSEHGFLNWMPDRLYLRWVYRLRTGKRLRLNDPQTFNEKLQWLKLYDRRPEYTQMADKYLAKDYIAARVGAEYPVPLLGVWKDAGEVDCSGLPERFVLKGNHDSGSVVLCSAPSEAELKKELCFLKKRLRKNAYWYGREWPYRNIEPRIICEQYLENDILGELRDYKLMCFGGRVRCVQVCTKRSSGDGLHLTYFDREWNRLPFERQYPADREPIEAPARFDEMVHLAEILSRDYPFLRVDFYETEKRLYIGELTLYPGSGFSRFVPDEWDRILGEWLILPKNRMQGAKNVWSASG